MALKLKRDKRYQIVNSNDMLKEGYAQLLASFVEIPLNQVERFYRGFLEGSGTMLVVKVELNPLTDGEITEVIYLDERTNYDTDHLNHICELLNKAYEQGHEDGYGECYDLDKVNWD